MFYGADSFEQNLGSWYIVLGDDEVERGQLEVTTVTAKNAYIGDLEPVLGVLPGGDGDHFTMLGNKLFSTSTVYDKDAYNITITAQDVLGLSLTHSKVVTINATGTAVDMPNLVSAKITGPNAITVVFNENVNTSSSNFMNLMLEGETNARSIISLEGTGTDTLTLRFGGTPVSTGAKGTLDVRGVTDSDSNLFAALVVPVTDGQKPVLASVSIGSSNTTATIAFAEDTVTLEFTASEEVSTPTVTINGTNSTPTNTSGNTWTSEFTVNEEDSGGNVEFTIDFTDLAGNAGDQVTATTDLSSVLVVTSASLFKTTWETTTANESITIPVGGATGTYMVDWGDDNTTEHTGDATHEYASPGEYTVQIFGDFERIKLEGTGYAINLKSIDQWGAIEWTSMESAFEGATNMAYNATDVPDLSGVTDMSYMFASATSFDGDISAWDVSKVEDMSYMFEGATAFNSNISAWTVSSVEDMEGMFKGASAFNQDISTWNVSKVTKMADMFEGATAFNSNISAWTVSSVEDMEGMFEGATAFNSNISAWTVSSVEDMEGMFKGASAFNQDISTWNVSKVTKMADMFEGATAFDQNLGSWYIVPQDAVVYRSQTFVTTINGQNSYLTNANPTYAVQTGGAGDQFTMNGKTLQSVSTTYDQDSYDITITSSDVLGLTRSHSKEMTVTVTDRPAYIQSRSTPPTLESADITGPNTITIVFDEGVMAYSSHFTGLTLAGESTDRKITAVSGSGTDTIVLTFSGSAASVDATGVINISGMANLRGTQFSATGVSVGDGQAPAMESAAITGSNTITIVFAEDVTASATNFTGFTLAGESTARDITGASGSSTDTIALTFSGTAASVDATGVINISGVADLSGNQFSATGVSVGDGQAPVMVSADITGPNTITIVYEDMKASSVDITGIILAGEDTSREITGVTSSGTDTLILTFDGPESSTDATGVININEMTDSNGNQSDANGVVLSDGQSPVLSSVSIDSSNSTAGTAEIGDTVSVTFESSEAITAVSVTINGNSSEATNTGGNTWTAARTIDTTDPVGEVTFMIDFEDLEGNAGATVTVTTDESSISIVEPTTTVRGTVFLDENGNGMMDAGEEGISGYTMYMIPISDPETSIESVTASDGTYSFGTVTADETMLVQTGFFPFDHTVRDPNSSWYRYVTLEEGEAVTFDVGFRPVTPDEAITINITAYSDDNANGTKDAGEAGVSGVRVTVYTYSTNELEAVSTGSDGTVSKSDLVPADIYVVVDPIPEGYLRATSPIHVTDDGELLGQLVLDDPTPGSVHSMEIGLVPAP